MKWTRDALVIGGFSLHYYGALIALGVLLGVLLAMKREKRLGLAKDTTIDLALVGVPAALVGARLYYVAFQWDFYKDDLWKIFSVREGGMAIYGGVLAALLAGGSSPACAGCASPRWRIWPRPLWRWGRP